MKKTVDKVLSNVVLREKIIALESELERREAEIQHLKSSPQRVDFIDKKGEMINPLKKKQKLKW